MFNKEQRREKRERRAAVKAELKEQIKPRATFAMKVEKEERRSKRREVAKEREDAAAQRLEELHAGAAAGQVAQTGSDLLYIPALSSIQFQVNDQTSNADRCYTRWTVYARHDKEFLGMAPTNREVHFGGVSISYYNEHKEITQEMHYWDMVTLLQQIQAP